MIANALKNTRLLILLMAVLVVSGMSAISTLPRAEDPNLINRWATITTAYPGASAERVESLVTEELENALRSLNEITLIESQSKAGLSVISIELNESLTDTETIWSKVRDKLSDATPFLPPDVYAPEFSNDNADAFTYITAIRWQENSKPDLLLMGRYATELARQWRNLSGTEVVKIDGLPEEEILVDLDEGELSLLGQSPLSVAQAVHQADATNASGSLQNDGYRFQIELGNSLQSLERIKSIPIQIDKQGSIVTLQDIAKVTKNHKTPESEIAIIDGEPVVLVSARMQKQMRVDLWTTNSIGFLDSFRQSLPSAIAIDTIFEQNRYTETRLSELLGSLLLGFSLIVLVLLMTLGFRSAILVALSLPVASAFTLAMMSFTHVPINQMSVTGLIVSLGIMVDNAIVMVDTIQQYRQQGVKRIQAAVKAIKHLWLPLLGSTLTTILAFAPIMLMPGAAGEFVGGIALTVSFSLVGSYLVSIILVSSFAARYLPATRANAKWHQTGIRLPKLSQAFRDSVMKALEFPKVTVLIISLVPLSGVISAGFLTEQFFPSSDRDMFEIQVYLAPQTNIQSTLALTEEIDAFLAKEEAIEQIGWMVGGNFPSFYYNLVPRQQGDPHFAQAMVKTTDFNEANRMIPALQAELSTQFPQAQILVRKLEQGPPFNAPIEVRVFGPNLDTLKAISEQIRLIMLSTPDVINTRETLQPGTPKMEVVIDDAASQITSWSHRDIASLLHASTTGIHQTNMLDKTESVPIRIRLGDKNRAEMDDLYQLQVPIQGSADFRAVPLAAMADLKVTPTQGAIPRRNGKRINVIEGYIQAGILPQTVLNAFMDKLEAANIGIPPGYSIEFGGESAERNESVNQLMANLTIVITMMIAVVVLSFRSFRISTVIFLVAWQAAGLGLLSVWLFSYPFGFTVIIALLGLIGLAINAAIVILAELMDDERARAGNKAAIVNTVSNCGRHITSTTITTIGGFLPLILSGGGFWPPFAVAVAGGTLLATLLSFYFVPAAYKLACNYHGFDQKDLFDLSDE